MLWTIKRYKDLQAKQSPSVDSSAAAAGSGSSTQPPQQGEEQQLTSEQQARPEKEARSRLAAEHRAKIMAQMQNAQKSFMKSNAELFANAGEEGTAGTATKQGGSMMDWEDIPEPKDEEGAAAVMPDPGKIVSCLGARRCFTEAANNSFKCILCFENCSTSGNDQPLVSSAFVQTSRVVYTTRMPTDTRSGLHVSCCGHVMHYNCWKEYYSSEESKEQRRPQRNRAQNQHQNVEFHCPYCRTLSNAVLPVSEPLSKFSQPQATSQAMSDAVDSYMPLDSFVELMRALSSLRVEGSPRVVQKYESLIGNMAQFERSAQIIKTPKLDKEYIDVMSSFHSALRNAKHSQMQGSLPKYMITITELQLEKVTVLWDACCYTLQALEVYLYITQKPLNAELPMRHQSCVSNLVRACALYSTKLNENQISEQSEYAAKLYEEVFDQKESCVLEWDCFRKLVHLTFAMPNLLIATDGK